MVLESSNESAVACVPVSIPLIDKTWWNCCKQHDRSRFSRSKHYSESLHVCCIDILVASLSMRTRSCVADPDLLQLSSSQNASWSLEVNEDYFGRYFLGTIQSRSSNLEHDVLQSGAKGRIQQGCTRSKPGWSFQEKTVVRIKRVRHQDKFLTRPQREAPRHHSSSCLSTNHIHGNLKLRFYNLSFQHVCFSRK